MLTVVIAEKQNIDSIRDYRLFLKPFTDNAPVKFCEWNTEGGTLEEAVGMLRRTVGKNRHWRAVILADESHIGQRNPFEAVKLSEPEGSASEEDSAESPLSDEVGSEPFAARAAKDENSQDKVDGLTGTAEAVTATAAETTDAETGGEPENEDEPSMDEILRDERYQVFLCQQKKLLKIRAAKFAAFEEAAKQPLTKLVTWLSEDPLVSLPDSGDAVEFRMDTDPEYTEYLAEMQKKMQLRSKIRSANTDSNDDFETYALPDEILCIAPRTCDPEKEEIETSWKIRPEDGYSRFYDWNLYYDRMRYLVFDLPPRNDSTYDAAKLRFLYTVIVLASHDLPRGSLRPNRVYNLICENDTEALTRLVSLYDGKLEATAEKLEELKRRVRETPKKPLTDTQAANIFGTEIHVPPARHEAMNKSDLTINPRRIGLVNGWPSDSSIWHEGRLRAEKKLLFMQRLPKRVIRKTALDMRELDHMDTSEAHQMTEFQIEDLEIHIGEEELAMARTCPPAAPLPSWYTEKVEESDREIRGEIATRMTKGRTLFFGGMMLALFAAGCLPLFYENAHAGARWVQALFPALLCVLILAAAGFLCLVFLRSGLTGLIEEFNTMVLKMAEKIQEMPKGAAVYMSHACNAMRGYSVLRYLKEHQDPKEEQLTVLKKHSEDIASARAGLRDMLGDFVKKLPEEEQKRIEPYSYDFSIPHDYEYPVPYTDDMKRDIEFIETGSSVTVPVDYVRKITVRREELR